MKKKTIANIVMVAVILVIAAAGVLTVGWIQGWFDQADGTQAVLCEMRGVIRLERDGVSYKVEGDTVLRTGDKITCDPGASTVIRLENGTLTLGEKAEVTIQEPSAKKFSAEVTAGEVFAHCEDPATLIFGGREVTLAQTTVLLSVQPGAPSISVLRGSVENASAGQIIHYIGETMSVGGLDVNSLNDFAIAQIRALGSSCTLYFSGEDLDRLAADRQAAIQDLIDSQTKPTEPSPDSTQSTAPSQETTPSEAEPDTSQGATAPPETAPSESSQATTPSETAPSEETKTPVGTCTITIRCDTILNNMGDLTPGKAGFVPADGVILPTVSISFYEGETVFDVLQRACQITGIQLEYSWSPMFSTYYVEGIHNLYEKDCGSESGWMYRVNGWFPNYGCSSYTLSDGDSIAWLYSCKGYGTDVGAPEYEG